MSRRILATILGVSVWWASPALADCADGFVESAVLAFAEVDGADAFAEELETQEVIVSGTEGGVYLVIDGERFFFRTER